MDRARTNDTRCDTGVTFPECGAPGSSPASIFAELCNLFSLSLVTQVSSPTQISISSYLSNSAAFACRRLLHIYRVIVVRAVSLLQRLVRGPFLFPRAGTDAPVQTRLTLKLQVSYNTRYPPHNHIIVHLLVSIPLARFHSTTRRRTLPDGQGRSSSIPTFEPPALTSPSLTPSATSTTAYHTFYALTRVEECTAAAQGPAAS